MALAPRIERDLLKRVIRVGDVCVWSNRAVGVGLVLIRVLGYNAKSLKVKVLATDRETRVEDSNNLLVISQQIESNIRENVGSNLDLEATR